MSNQSEAEKQEHIRDATKIVSGVKDSLTTQQEPVACQHKRYSIDVTEQIGTCYDCGAEGRMRFVVDDTHQQPKREWVGLTDEEYTKMWHEHMADAHISEYGRAIETKLKELNT